MDESYTPPVSNPEKQHSLEELNQLYDYLIDTYGVDSQQERKEFPPINWEERTLPKLTGIAAVKATIFGDKRPAPKPPAPEVYVETSRIVDMPILPARNPNDTRAATIRRRQSIKQAPVILFQSLSERSDEEAKARSINKQTTDTHSGGVLYYRLGKGEIAAESGSLWFDYLTKVKEYRDSGEYEKSGHGPFLDDNADLLESMEKSMGFQENDDELRWNAKRTFEQHQIDRSRQLIRGLLADAPVPQWHHVDQYVDWYGNYGGDYDVRIRKVEIKPEDGSPLPTLHITERESNHEPMDIGGQNRSGLVTTYSISLGENEDRLMIYTLKDDFTPKGREYYEPKDRYRYFSPDLTTDILDEETRESIKEQMKAFEGVFLSDDSLFTQAQCNVVLAKYRELEEQGRAIKSVVDTK